MQGTHLSGSNYCDKAQPGKLKRSTHGTFKPIFAEKRGDLH